MATSFQSIRFLCLEKAKAIPTNPNMPNRLNNFSTIV